MFHSYPSIQSFAIGYALQHELHHFQNCEKNEQNKHMSSPCDQRPPFNHQAWTISMNNKEEVILEKGWEM